MRYKNNKLALPKEIYRAQLNKINAVALSQREIDIIACILSGRSAKGIAQFLSISYRTVQVHTFNAMKKLGCTSRESMISLVEKSDQFIPLKEYYLSLLTYNTFEGCLKEVAKLGNGPRPTCIITYWDISENPFFNYLKEHLTLAGMSVLLEVREKKQLFSQLLQEARHDIYTLYALPHTWLAEHQAEPDLQQPSQESSGRQRNILFLLSETEQLREIPQEINTYACLDLAQQENYYFSVFALLKRIIPYMELDDIISEFKDKYDQIYGSGHHPVPQIMPPLDDDHTSHTNYRKILRSIFSISRKKLLIGSAAGIAAIWALLLIMWPTIGEKTNQSNIQATTPSIRSDLPIPTNHTLLKRQNILAQMEEIFKGQGGIRLVVLAGIGGSGKTTLARLYAGQQDCEVIWEINAESHESLVHSFEKLGYALSRTQEERLELKEIQRILDKKKQESTLALFIKKLLKTYPGWLLIYDNVESFSDIRDFFPQDFKAWGEGKVIITTRDSNIGNSDIINNSYVILLEELDATDKFSLFQNIVNPGQNLLSDIEGKKRVNQFLENIPSFPLDISIVAKYLRITKTSFDDYLKLVKDNSQDNLLKTISGQEKTRYSIITASLNLLLKESPEYRDLLVLISLIESQDIPIDLLSEYKNQTFAHKFLHGLKKQSLVLGSSVKFDEPLPKFSIHRSTQEAIRAYILKSLNIHNKKDNNKIKSISYYLCCYMDKLIKKDNFQEMKPLINHIETFLKYESLLSDEALANLSNNLALMYSYFGANQRSLSLFKTSLGIFKKLYRDNHVKVASVKRGLGAAYREVGDYEQSKFFLEQALEVFKGYYGDDNRETAETYIQLGNVYRNIRDYHRSKEVFEHVLLFYEKNDGKDHVNVAWLLVQLGFVYKRFRHYKLSIDTLNKGFDIYNRHYGINNVYTAWALSYLGNVYGKCGQYNKALKNLHQALTVFRKHYGNQTVREAYILVNLGNVYQKQGHYQKACEFFQKAHELFNAHYGKDHFDTCWGAIHLGDLYRLMGNYTQAKNLIEPSVEFYRKKYGNNHSSTGWALLNLGSLYKDLGAYEKAQRLFDETLEIYGKHFGKEHVDISQVLRNIGEVYLLKGGLDKAHIFLMKALKIDEKNNSIEICFTFEALGDFYLKEYCKFLNKNKLGDTKQASNKALSFFEKAEKLAETQFPADSAHIRRIQDKSVNLKDFIVSVENSSNSLNVAFKKGGLFANNFISIDSSF